MVPPERDAPSPRPHGASRRRAKTSAAVLAVVVLAGEVGLRLLFPAGLEGRLETEELYPWVVFDPLLSWRNSPGHRQEGIAVGAYGERLVDPPEESSPTATRILFLGDSRTFGIWRSEDGLHFDNDFPSRLARLAKARVEAFNGGTIGYTSSQGLRQWMLLHDRIDPDVVVVAFGVNENLPAWNPSYRVSEPRSTLARSLFYGLARFRWVQLGFWVARRSPWSPAETDWKPWVSLEEHRRNLERFAAESRRRDVKLLFLHLPLRPLALGENAAPPDGEATPVQIYGANSLEELHAVHGRFRDVARDVARSRGVPFLDASDGFEAFRESHPGVELYSPYDLVHPDPLGADVIARLLEDELVSLGLLAPEAGGDRGH